MGASGLWRMYFQEKPQRDWRKDRAGEKPGRGVISRKPTETASALLRRRRAA